MKSEFDTEIQPTGTALMSMTVIAHPQLSP